MSSIAARIRRARKRAGLSQGDVAQRSGLSLTGFGDIERGTASDPHVSTLENIADALGTTVSELLSEEAELAGTDRASETARSTGVDVASLNLLASLDLPDEAQERFIETYTSLQALERDYPGLGQQAAEGVINSKRDKDESQSTAWSTRPATG